MSNRWTIQFVALASAATLAFAPAGFGGTSGAAASGVAPTPIAHGAFTLQPDENSVTGLRRTLSFRVFRESTGAVTGTAVLRYGLGAGDLTEYEITCFARQANRALIGVRVTDSLFSDDFWSGRSGGFAVQDDPDLATLIYHGAAGELVDCESFYGFATAHGLPFSDLSAFLEHGGVPIEHGQISFEQAWDPAADWVTSPQNPAPDAYGNDGVWSYMKSASFARDPDEYSLLPHFEQERSAWTDPANVNLLVGRPTQGLLLMHSWGGRVIDEARMAVLRWRSPANGRFRVTGAVALPPASECSVGSGIVWAIHGDTEEISTTGIPAGSSTTFDLQLNLAAGESLYFVHDPGFDSNCDSAALSLLITRG